MTSQSGAAGEIALRLAEIATSSENVYVRDAAIMRLLRERLGATFIAVYKAKTRAGKTPTLRIRASDESVIHPHPFLERAARDAARVWLASGVATPCVLDDPRFGGWQVAGCLPGGELAVVALWPPDGDAAVGAEILAALAPMLSLTLGRGGRREHARNSGDDSRVDAAKTEFVSLVSHALRTPLNTLTGFVEIVLDQPVGPLNDRQREFLGYARESGQALTQLVEDVTLLSRADEGSLMLRCAPVDGLEVAQRALRTVETAADVKSVRLSLRIEGETLSLEGDGDWLAHALVKLLENAVKFSPEGGEVILSVTASDGAVHFAVSDRGLGVAPEDAERIFTRFYQAEITAKSHPGGYGLGLAVAKVIADAHGGSIRIESAPEQGATFTLSVPLNVAVDVNHRAATKIRRGESDATSSPP
ncbi:MAG TPA: HAMP domain-containing sensor histidine kinase [Ktedonobacterales bacterium]|jgi:signal transduction histidine kinase